MNTVPAGVIYAIIDPRTDAIRYIGKAANFGRRRRDHRNELRRGVHYNPYLQNWYNKLVRAGHLPMYRVLQECLPGMVDACEQEWIAKGRAKGWRLCNLTDGGEGGEWSEDAKRRQSERTKAMYRDPEYVQRFREGQERRHSGIRSSPAYQERARHREANREQNRRNMALAAERKRMREAVLVPLTHKGAAFIPLTKGLWAVVDAEDWSEASRYTWHAQPHQGRHRAVRNDKGSKVFLRRTTKARHKQRVVYPSMVDCRKSNDRIRRRFVCLGMT